jgi:hypothetical protein
MENLEGLFPAVARGSLGSWRWRPSHSGTPLHGLRIQERRSIKIGLMKISFT